MEPIARPGSFPTASAVSINIFEPKAYAGSPPATAPMGPYPAPMAYPQPQVYNYPNTPIYDMPQAPIYAPQQAPMFPPQAPMYPPQAPMYPPVDMQQPVQTPNYPPYYPQQPTMTPVQYPAAPAPQAPSAPATPPPPAIDQQQPPAAQAPTVEQPKQPQQPPVDVAAINAALQSPNLDEQNAAIQKIAEVGQTSKEQGIALLNEQVFRGLTNVITRDTNKLQGPEKEKAETNKMIGMWTLAVLQKNFREAMDVEAQKQNVPSITINELPGIVQVVNNVKADPNPNIREAAISALTYIARPEDAQVLSTVFEIAAKQDADPKVKAAAQQALSVIPKGAQAPQGK